MSKKSGGSPGVRRRSPTHSGDPRATGRDGKRWNVIVAGAYTTVRPGLADPNGRWETLGKAMVLQALNEPLLVITPRMPRRGSPAAKF